eukprot:scaffold290531_cov18-Prasinocladus_malaysianus.AAC.1
MPGTRTSTTILWTVILWTVDCTIYSYELRTPLWYEYWVLLHAYPYHHPFFPTPTFYEIELLLASESCMDSVASPESQSLQPLSQMNM